MTPFQIGDQFVDDLLALSPMLKTSHGIKGADGEWDDFSPHGHDEKHELAVGTRDTLAEHLTHDDPDQRHAARVLHDRLAEGITSHEAGDHLRDVGHIYCPFTEIRDIFEIMDRSSAEGWEDVSSRLRTVDQPLQGYRETLELGRERDLLPAQRQVESVISQARHLAGDDSAWKMFPAQAVEAGGDADQVGDAVDTARRAVSDFADWMESSYVGDTPIDDAVGEERWLRSADSLIGLDLDPSDVYQWGWGEVERLRDEMKRVAAEIDPNADVASVIETLETDPDRSASSLNEFCEFVQELLDTAVEQLDGVHFDVPAPARRVTVNLAPPGGALGAWYINPSEDWSRPGSVWYSLGDVETVPLWNTVSTAYHEGFPGHHLQVATVLDQSEHLSRAHRLLIWYSGYGEGWALYTERLMEELGFLERPEYHLGMLANQLFRAVRVVVDTGLHLGYTIPEAAPLHGGEPWSFDIGVEYAHKIGLQTEPMAESEVKRYLGWPAQAISYKIGEREILRIRDELRSRPGFDLKSFNAELLVRGEVRLDYLQERMVGGDH